MSKTLAKIHIAKKEMALHDDDYRAILQRETGQVTARGLTDAQADRVLEAFKRLGWKPTLVVHNRKAGVTVKQPAQHPTAKKARALWISLGQLGVVRDPSEAALEAFGRRQLGVDKLQWADAQEMYRLIEALKKMAERAGWSQDLTGVPASRHVEVLKFRLDELIAKKRGAAMSGAAMSDALFLAAAAFMWLSGYLIGRERD